ncbi:MAG: FAD-dependent monooxygenase [Thermoleophilia bacterium]|nr:FAD-dependent monooxygenase [Thermoleophilia bacterium]
MPARAARLTCLVAGAGMGGLSAAIALRRAGHEVFVVEQADALGVVGAGIQMAANAARLLDRWGALDHMRDSCVPAEAAVRRRWDDGTVLGEVPLGAQVIARVGASYWCCHRADLHAALVRAATGPGGGIPVQLVLGSHVTHVTRTGPDAAAVMTADGVEYEADVVVGADGVRSAVRESLFGPQAPTFSGRVTNRHIIDMPDLAADRGLMRLLARPAQNIWIGPAGHVITHPIRGGGGVYMGVTTAGTPEDRGFWSSPVDRAVLHERFAGWDPRIHRLMDAAPEVTAYGLHDRTPLPEWARGRVCLLGDACHPMLPFQAQGAVQAIEDAAVLADVLTGATAADVPAALARYAAIRRPRAARVQAASRENGRLFHLPDGPDQRRRDADLAAGRADFSSYEWLWTREPDGTLPEASVA